MNSFEILTDIGDYPEQRRLTEEAIEQAYVNAGFNLAEFPPPNKEAPTLKEVIALLEEQLQGGTYQYPAELENAVYRLRQFAREGEDYFARKSTLDLGKLASSGLVDIDLSGLPDERFRALAALFILQTLKEKMRMEGWSASKGLKALVVLDEAWKVASDERSDAITIVREGRKYQFGLIVASQNPTDINEAIFSNVGTTVILRIRFERFLDYLQGSLNFSSFMRQEISKFGVGQAAIDMSFQTNVEFSDTFLIDRVIGEIPLDVYTINVSEILNQAELADQNVQKEYFLERTDINAKLIDSNVSSEAIEAIFKQLDGRGRLADIRDLVQIMSMQKINKETIMTFLRNIGLPDQIILRAFAYVS